MRERRKDALKLLAIATPMLAYGAFTFEIGGAGSNVEAISVAVSLTLGLVGVVSGLVMFFTKNSLGMVETKPMAERVETKPMAEVVQEEEPKLKMPS
tara:strand:- start:46 stop:336 length:291 start_codon:yes stop_codon:yes gene_type:complete